jgi:hypothetical protein
MKRLLAVILWAIPCLAQTNNARMLSGVNYQSGTTYTFVAADATRIVSFSNAVAVAATLPNGVTAGFGAGYQFSIVNVGAGTVTITCSSCTINGLGTLVLVTSAAVDLYGDGVNYIANLGVPTNLGSPGPIGGTTPNVGTFTQLNLAGTGGLNSISPGGTLATPGPGNGAISIGPGGIPQISSNNSAYFAIPYITIGGTALANTANNTNFSNSSPTAPTNGLNVQWNFLGQNISAAIVGDGNPAHCFIGTGVFAACGSGSAGAVSALTAATGSNTIANGNFPQTWNNAQTSNSQSGQTFGETSAATGGTLTSGIANQAEVTVSVASGSTATPLSVVQGSVTGTTAVPAMQIQTTFNNAGLTGETLVIGITDTASTVNSAGLDIQKPFGSSVFKVDKYGDVAIANLSAFGGNAAAANITLCGGNALGQACVSNTNGTVGGITVQGSDNSSNGASAKAGYAIYRCGALTNATPNAAALPGVCQLVEELEKGSAVANVGDVVCMGTVAFQVTDCSHTGPVTNIIGIASSTSNPISVVVEGDALVKVSNTAAIGDYVCWTGAAGTDGVPVDNGTTACAAHQNVGIVVAISGTLTQSSGTGTASTAMSTSLPLVQLHIGS